MTDDDQPTTDHPRGEPATRWAVRVETALLWCFLGLGVGCLLGALAVGAYTLFGASRANACAGNACVATTDLATSLAWYVVAAAAVLLANLTAISLQRTGVRALTTKWMCVLAAFTATGVVVQYNITHYTQVRSQIEAYQPASEQMWTVTVAVWLFAAGGALVAILGVPLLARPRQKSTVGLVVGVVAAGIITSVVGATALHRGDDSQYVDATTASLQAVPALPAVLGSQRFERQLPNRGGVEIYPAGAGFIVKALYERDGTVPDVVAYSALGEERWHYRRTGPVAPPSGGARSSMRVHDLAYFDDGAVVVLSFFSDRGPYVGLDAVTGAQLWTSTDPAIGNALKVARANPRAQRFLARVDDQLIALDPHTGQRLWTIDDPMHCPVAEEARQPLPNFDQLHVYPVDTQTRIAAVLDCSTHTTMELRLVVVDPATGTVTLNDSLTTFDDVAREDLNSWAAYPVSGSDAVLVGLYGKGPTRDLYVNDSTGKRVDFVYPEWVGADAEGIFTVRDKERLRIYTGDANAQCDIALGTKGDMGYTILGEQIVVRALAPGALAVFDRASCQQVATVPVPSGYEVRPIPVRGATLMTRTDKDDRTTVLGFAP